MTYNNIEKYDPKHPAGAVELIFATCDFAPASAQQKSHHPG
jgi:hypothetical protein